MCLLVKQELVVWFFMVVLMAAAVLVEHVCVQKDQYHVAVVKTGLAEDQTLLTGGRIYEELSSSPTATTEGRSGSVGGSDGCEKDFCAVLEILGDCRAYYDWKATTTKILSGD